MAAGLATFVPMMSWKRNQQVRRKANTQDSPCRRVYNPVRRGSIPMSVQNQKYLLDDMELTLPKLQPGTTPGPPTSAADQVSHWTTPGFSSSPDPMLATMDP